MDSNYNLTVKACFLGYIVQAIVNNFVPLLFLTFQSVYGISLEKITLLITFNFLVQLAADLVSVSFVDKIGYRASMLIALGASALGFMLLPVLPGLAGDPFAGIVLCVVLYAVGGGLLEVLVSPIVESCPSDDKERTMSMLHSFYCWGQVGVVLLSTVFFAVFGIENWKFMALIWGVVPLCNFLLFMKVPIAPLVAEDEERISLVQLLRNSLFWIFCVLMLCAGACELSVSQWASTFAEKGLGVSKTVGDLMGPMMFAVLMGSARTWYGKFGGKVDLRRFMTGSICLCVVSYLLVSLSQNAVIGLAGCALCGLSVGILWPGTFSLASASLRRGGTALFAILALAGDMGCCAGPTFVGFVSSAYGENLKAGIFAALVFPLLFLSGMALYRNYTRRGRGDANGDSL